MPGVLVGPEQQHRHVEQRVGLEVLGLGLAGQRRANFAQERARLPLPPTSAKAWRMGRARRGCRAPTGARPLGAHHQPDAVRQRPVQGPTLPARATSDHARMVPGRATAPCRRLDMSTRPLRAEPAGGHRTQQDLRAHVVAGHERPWAQRLAAEARDHLGEPVERVGWRGRSSESPCSGRSGRTTRKRSAGARRRARTRGASARPSAAAPGRPGPGLAVGDRAASGWW